MGFSVIHFFICNIFISVIIGIIFLARRTFLKNSPPRFQYSLWFVLPVLMAAPFLKLKTPGFLQLLEHFPNIKNTLNISANSGIQPAANQYPSSKAGWTDDFTISLDNNFLQTLEIILACIWISGILVMAWFYKARQYR